MANKKITELTELPVAAQNDVLPIVDVAGPETKKIKISGLKDSLNLNRSDVGLSNVDNTSDVNKPISTATQDALDLKADEADLQSHVNDTANPHSVTKAQVGLDQVDNTSDADKPVSIATQTALNLKANSVDVYTKMESDLNFEPKNPNIQAHIIDLANPHQVTKSQVGLDQVDNTSDADKPISTSTQSALDLKANSVDLQTHVNDVANPHQVTKSQVGLDQVDNTSDADKAISTATQAALNLKEDAANKGASNGYTPLVDGMVPAIYLPGYVDDVVEAANYAALPIPGEISKLYITLDNHKTYRYSGTTYVEVSPSDVNSVNGKIGIVVLDKTDIGLSNVDNTSDIDKPISTATQDALNLKADALNLFIHTTDISNPHQVTKTQVGLDQVDNTSDLDKPISTATQNELGNKINRDGDNVMMPLEFEKNIGNMNFSYHYLTTIKPEGLTSNLTYNQVVPASLTTTYEIGLSAGQISLKKDSIASIPTALDHVTTKAYVDEQRDVFYFNTLVISGPIWTIMYDPNSWISNDENYTSNRRMARNVTKYLNLKWKIETFSAITTIGPFETLNEYRDAIQALDDAGPILRVTPFYIIEEKLGQMVTSGYAFNTAMLNLFRQKYVTKARRYYDLAAPFNADENKYNGPNRDILLQLWEDCFGYESSTVFSDDPLQSSQIQCFVKRRKDSRPNAFPKEGTFRDLRGGAVGLYGYNPITTTFSPVPNGESLIGSVGARVIFGPGGGTFAPDFTYSNFPGLKKFSGRESLTVGSVAAFPIFTGDHQSILLWSNTLDSVTFTMQNFTEDEVLQFSNNYQIEAIVIEKNIMLRSPMSVLGSDHQQSRIQCRLDSIEVRKKIGTIVRFRIRNKQTGLVSPYLPIQLRVKKLGPVISLVSEPYSER